MASKKSTARKSTAPAVAVTAEPGKPKKPRYRLCNRANPPVEVTAEPHAKGGWTVQGERGKPIRLTDADFAGAFKPC